MTPAGRDSVGAYERIKVGSLRTAGSCRRRAEHGERYPFNRDTLSGTPNKGAF